MPTYRVENGRGQAGSSHQLKLKQSSMALFRPLTALFLARLSLIASLYAPQFRREYAATQLLDLTDTLQSHSLTRVHRISPREGIHTI
ncbi:hypothetical protein ALC53_11699 [Atta colombica]|uniref:Uncharacterized protein n=1 Tax=Atta colombica TaxID=520822 RepID=A0A195B0G1_9HYME|nr:hypothetical protein ALC53_11699 [Atta colombica]